MYKNLIIIDTLVIGEEAFENFILKIYKVC
jgi:hypothetical protein